MRFNTFPMFPQSMKQMEKWLYSHGFRGWIYSPFTFYMAFYAEPPFTSGAHLLQLEHVQMLVHATQRKISHLCGMCTCVQCTCNIWKQKLHSFGWIKYTWQWSSMSKVLTHLSFNTKQSPWLRGGEINISISTDMVSSPPHNTHTTILPPLCDDLGHFIRPRPPDCRWYRTSISIPHIA